MARHEVRFARKKILGFTLVEIVIGMAIIGVLLSITIAAINPLGQFAKSRDTKRRADVEALANAIQQYTAGNNGTGPTGITSSSTPIATGGVDVCNILVPEYISALPQDPSQNNGARIVEASCSSYDTGYEINSEPGGHFAVTAPGTEGDEQISQIR